MKKEIEILENVLSGALLVPSECALVNTEIIKICLDTLKTYESWEDLIRYEIEKQIRADERAKVLNAVYECGWHCEVHSREALTAMVNDQLKEQ